MGDLNNIQDEINAEMYGDLADVTYPYKGIREVRGKFDPENPRPISEQEYFWKGIFGLSFDIKDTEFFNIQTKDQKGLVFMRDNDLDIPFNPEIDEVIEVKGEKFAIVAIRDIPANNGFVLQMRKYG